MKQSTSTWIAAITFCLLSVSSFSQENPVKTPKWVSDMGYWVVETNTHAQLDHTIRFYNNDDVLIYTENVNGVKLNPTKRKVRMKLKKALEMSVLAWEKTKTPGTNKDYVTAILK